MPQYLLVINNDKRVWFSVKSYPCNNSAVVAWQQSLVVDDFFLHHARNSVQQWKSSTVTKHSSTTNSYLTYLQHTLSLFLSDHMCVFRFTDPTAIHLLNTNAKFQTLSEWGGKRLHCTTNLLRTICTYQKRSGFVENMTKKRFGELKQKISQIKEHE